ncbi:MAG: M24 family metallopeptidase [Methanomassiliicoccales archaeon]|nr:MAG: M24 family metallopeptidase [Methanomassiliicoccales archaeon]
MRKIMVYQILFIYLLLFVSDAVQVNGNAETFQQIEPDVVKNQLLLESAKISDKGMETAKNTLIRAFFENITEADVIRAINDAMTDNGSSEYVEAFGVIVASGEQSALPHGDTSDDETNQILPGEVVVVDLGARYRGYCTDLTRTFFMGNATQEMMDIYNITLEAQLAAIEAVRSGVLARDVDKVARDIISNYGYGENFIHGLGHGIGIYIHMPPTLDPDSMGILFESGNMAITIEPGIYLEEQFGIRIEDDVFVLRTGSDLLTSFPKGLENAILYSENMTADTVVTKDQSEQTSGGTNFLLALGVVFILVVIGIIVIKSRKQNVL